MAGPRGRTQAISLWVSESSLRSMDFKVFAATDLCGLDERMKVGELHFSSALHYADISDSLGFFVARYSFPPKKTDANAIRLK